MAISNDEYPTLVAQTGPLNGQRWLLSNTLLLGRDDSCDIIIPDRQVSRHHARLISIPEGTLLEDLGSKNGTHLNGQEVLHTTTLQDGDMIQIALAQQFIYLSSDATLPLDGRLPETIESIESHAGLLRLDKRSRRVWIGDQEILPPLSVSQYQMLELLYEHQGQVISRTELISIVWGKDDAVGVSEQALDALVRRLRDRLAAVDPTHPYIITVRGHGLRLDNPALE